MRLSGRGSPHAPCRRPHRCSREDLWGNHGDTWGSSPSAECPTMRRLPLLRMIIPGTAERQRRRINQGPKFCFLSVSIRSVIIIAHERGVVPCSTARDFVCLRHYGCPGTRCLLTGPGDASGPRTTRSAPLHGASVISQRRPDLHRYVSGATQGQVRRSSGQRHEHLVEHLVANPR